MMRMKWAKEALGEKRDKEPRVSVPAVPLLSEKTSTSLNEDETNHLTELGPAT